MGTVNVTIRIDENLKKQADELFSDFGLTLNGAITMFIKQAVREQRIPFEITRSTVTTPSDATLAAISKEIINKNRKAYEELAK